jgi:hypothetical protein
MQVGRVQRRQAGERRQCHVGQEFLGDADVLDVASTRQRGDDVGAAADQADRQVVRQLWRRVSQQRRARDLQAAVRALAEQRGDLVARQGDFLVDGLQFRLRRRNRGAGLRGFHLGVEAGGQPLTGQIGQVRRWAMARSARRAAQSAASGCRCVRSTW